ncbi:MAG: polyprenyl synthetase family protein [Thermoplasmatota archaeon]
MDIRKVMSREKELIESEISQFFQEESLSSPDDPLAQDLLDNIRDFTMRDAKRVRSILVVMGYRSVGGSDLDRARKAAVSMELIQSMLLIHDDIMDRSDLRRGAPSFHRVYSRIHRDKGYLGDPEEFGLNMALIAGDLAESFGEKALMNSGFASENIQRALRCQTEMIRDTGFGQMLDLYSVELPNWSGSMVEKVHINKTARYTFDAPLRIGAELCSAKPEQLRTLADYAIPVGVAFQIIDDIIGFYGDPMRGGKEDLSDIKEGKRTLLILKALELVNEREMSIIQNALGKSELTVEEAEEVRKVVKRSGAEAHSRKRAEELTRSGAEALKGSALDPDMIDFLTEFSDHLMKRA